MAGPLTTVARLALAGALLALSLLTTTSCDAPSPTRSPLPSPIKVADVGAR